MCIHCYRTEALTIKKRFRFIVQLPKIIYMLFKRKQERLNKKYNHFWVSRTIAGKESEPVRYYAKNAIKSKYDYSDIGNSQLFFKKEYAEFMAAVFESYQQPKNKITSKVGYMEYIEDVSLINTLLLIPYAIVKIFKAKSIGTIFN